MEPEKRQSPRHILPNSPILVDLNSLTLPDFPTMTEASESEPGPTTDASATPMERLLSSATRTQRLLSGLTPMERFLSSENSVEWMFSGATPMEREHHRRKIEDPARRQSRRRLRRSLHYESDH